MWNVTRKIEGADFRLARTLFFSTFSPYIRDAGSPAMEINCRRNKPFGPGGSTRRLHQNPSAWHDVRRVSAGANQDRRGRKGRVFSRYGSAVIGLCNSCKRQLCSGCSGCVTQFERPSLKSWRVKLRQAGFGGTWQQKPPLHFTPDFLAGFVRDFLAICHLAERFL